MFRYEVLHEDSRATVLLDGDVDIEVTEMIEEELASELSSSKNVIFDFEKVSFVDSSGIGLLITLITAIKDQGQDVFIRNLSPDVKMVFDLLQLPEILGHDVFGGH